MKTGLKVIDVMTNKPFSILPTQTIKEAAKKIEEHDIGSLLVTENNSLKGIVTERDIVSKAVSKGMDVETTIKDIMVEKLITITPEKDVYDAIKVMKDNDIRHLPVINEGKLMGLITLKTILKIQPQLFELMVDKIELHHRINIRRDEMQNLI